MFELLDKIAVLIPSIRPSTKDALSSLLVTVYWQHVLVVEFCQRVLSAVGVTLTILNDFGPILQQIAQDGETPVEIPTNAHERAEANETTADGAVNESDSPERETDQAVQELFDDVTVTTSDVFRSRRIPRKPRGKRVAELVIFWENISLQNQEHNRRLHVLKKP